MKCPIDSEHHDCVAIDLYMTWPNDYPYSPCVNCNQKRINELKNKIKNKDKELEQYMTDKERLMKFIDNIVPNDFKCGHLSLSFADDGSALLSIGNKEDAYNTDRIAQDERERIVSWLGKFCRHIDNFDISLNDYENTEFFKEKMYQQFGWEKT